ncbi:MAG: nucleotide exchange factor GrpE [Pirellulales bacterium]|nr:nucleotide exchange factor GrpE [Pirellulales bacterium]
MSEPASPTQHPVDIDDLSAELLNDPAQLADQLRQMRDRWLRSQAELDNYRKRVERERADEYRYREVPLLMDLLPVLDNAERAIDAAAKTSDAASLLTGYQMLRQQLHSVLQKHGCESIAAAGEPFDPNFHQAIMQQPSGDVPENTVLQVAQAGYKVHDRVIRPVQVIVSKNPE